MRGRVGGIEDEFMYGLRGWGGGGGKGVVEDSLKSEFEIQFMRILTEAKSVIHLIMNSNKLIYKC